MEEVHCGEGEGDVQAGCVGGRQPFQHGPRRGEQRREVGLELGGGRGGGG